MKSHSDWFNAKDIPQLIARAQDYFLVDLNHLIDEYECMKNESLDLSKLSEGDKEMLKSMYDTCLKNTKARE